MDLDDIHWDDELSPVDYTMFRADADRRSRTTMLFLETLDRTPDRARLRDTVDRASRVVPRLRQHVVAPLVPLSPARWVLDPDFDLNYHLRFIALPEPADFRHLLDFAQRFHATPLDMDRPLWEVTVVEGLDEPGSPAALIWKLSHAVTDGIGGMVLDSIIRNGERDPELPPMPPVPAPEDLTPTDLTRRAVRQLPIQLLRSTVRRSADALGVMRRSIQDPSGTASGVMATIGEVRKLAAGAPAPPSPLLAGRSLNRRFEALDVPLADLRAAAKSCGCSVNDAYLAALGGALGSYHRMLGMPIDHIATGMPVSVRSANRDGSNQWSAALLAVPTGDMDAAERMAKAREQVLTARSESGFDPMATIAPVLAWLPQPILAGVGTGILGIDIQASNVAGHPQPRFIAGCKVTRVAAMGPLPGVAMMATMTSMSGQCYVGINYDTASITDAERFATSLREAFAEVVAVGSSEAGAVKKAPVKKVPAKKTPVKKARAKRPSASPKGGQS